MLPLAHDATAPAGGLPLAGEQRFVVRGVSWSQYVAMRDALHDHSGVRMTFIEGMLEIMSPSRRHEKVSRTIARLLFAWADHAGVDLYAYGSTTFRREAVARGTEPDECFNLHPVADDDSGTPPDLAIEVVVSSGWIDKLEVYRGLRVPEVWFWRDAQIAAYVLAGDAYEQRDRSALLPGVDLDAIARLADTVDQAAAIREFKRSVLSR